MNLVGRFIRYRFNGGYRCSGEYGIVYGMNAHCYFLVRTGVVDWIDGSNFCRRRIFRGGCLEVGALVSIKEVGDIVSIEFLLLSSNSYLRRLGLRLSRKE